MRVVVVPVDSDYREGPAILRLLSSKDFDVFAATALYTYGLFAERVLVDSDEVLVFEDGEGLLGDCVEVAPYD